MNSTRILIATAIASALTSCGEDIPKSKSSMEKCYGVVKAGQNDCASTGHSSCAGSSTVDGDKAAWLLLPSGTCERLQGGSLIPGKGVNIVTSK